MFKVICIDDDFSIKSHPRINEINEVLSTKVLGSKFNGHIVKPGLYYKLSSYGTNGYHSDNFKIIDDVDETELVNTIKEVETVH